MGKGGRRLGRENRFAGLRGLPSRPRPRHLPPGHLSLSLSLSLSPGDRAHGPLPPPRRQHQPTPEKMTLQNAFRLISTGATTNYSRSHPQTNSKPSCPCGSCASSAAHPAPGLQPTCLASDSQANITAFATRSFNAETTPLQRTRCYRPGKNRPRAGVRPQLTIDISDGIKCLQLFLKETKWIKTNPKLIKWEWGTYLFTISTRVEQWFSSWDRDYLSIRPLIGQLKIN